MERQGSNFQNAPYARKEGRKSIFSKVKDSLKDIFSPSWISELVHGAKKESPTSIEQDLKSDNVKSSNGGVDPFRYQKTDNTTFQNPSQTLVNGLPRNVDIRRTDMMNDPGGMVPFHASVFNPSVAPPASLPVFTSAQLPLSRITEKSDRAMAHEDSKSELSDVSRSTSGCSSMIARTAEQSKRDVVSEKRKVTSDMDLLEDASICSSQDLPLAKRPKMHFEENISFSKPLGDSSMQKPTPAAVVSNRPFNASSFGLSLNNESTLLGTSFHESSFYPGKTTYGGRSSMTYRSQKNRDFNQSLPSRLLLPTKAFVKAKSRQNVTKEAVTSSTARRIMKVLDKIPTPSNDTKKIPLIMLQHWTGSSSLRERKSPWSGPTTQKLTISSQATVAKNPQVNFLDLQSTSQMVPDCLMKLPPVRQDTVLLSNESGLSGKMKRDKSYHKGSASVRPALEEEDNTEVSDLQTKFVLPVAEMPRFSFTKSPSLLVTNDHSSPMTQPYAVDSKSEHNFTFASPIEVPKNKDTSPPQVPGDFQFSSPISMDNNNANKPILTAPTTTDHISSSLQPVNMGFTFSCSTAAKSTNSVLSDVKAFTILHGGRAPNMVDAVKTSNTTISSAGEFVFNNSASAADSSKTLGFKFGTSDSKDSSNKLPDFKTSGGEFKFSASADTANTTGFKFGSAADSTKTLGFKFGTSDSKDSSNKLPDFKTSGGEFKFSASADTVNTTGFKFGSAADSTKTLGFKFGTSDSKDSSNKLPDFKTSGGEFKFSASADTTNTTGFKFGTNSISENSNTNKTVIGTVKFNDVQSSPAGFRFNAGSLSENRNDSQENCLSAVGFQFEKSDNATSIKNSEAESSVLTSCTSFPSSVFSQKKEGSSREGKEPLQVTVSSPGGFTYKPSGQITSVNNDISSTVTNSLKSTGGFNFSTMSSSSLLPVAITVGGFMCTATKITESSSMQGSSKPIPVGIFGLKSTEMSTPTSSAIGGFNFVTKSGAGENSGQNHQHDASSTSAPFSLNLKPTSAPTPASNGASVFAAPLPTTSNSNLTFGQSFSAMASTAGVTQPVFGQMNTSTNSPSVFQFGQTNTAAIVNFSTVSSTQSGTATPVCLPSANPSFNFMTQKSETSSKGMSNSVFKFGQKLTVSAAGNTPNFGTIDEFGSGSGSVFGSGTPFGGIVPSTTLAFGSAPPAFGSGLSTTPSFESGLSTIPSFGSGLSTTPSFGSGLSTTPGFGSGSITTPGFGSGSGTTHGFGSGSSTTHGCGAGVFGLKTDNAAVTQTQSNTVFQFGKPADQTQITGPTGGFSFGASTGPSSTPGCNFTAQTTSTLPTLTAQGSNAFSATSGGDGRRMIKAVRKLHR